MKAALIVEDDKIVNELFAAFVKHTNEFTAVDSVESGEEALELFEEGKYDIVVIDIGLLGMSGVDVCIEMREQDKEVILLGITGYFELTEKFDFSIAGFDAYFTKPAEYKDFFDFVKGSVDKKREKEKL